MDDGGNPLDGCPYDRITPAVDAMMCAVELAIVGSWPMAGGWMDQADPVVRAVRVWRRALEAQDNGEKQYHSGH